MKATVTSYVKELNGVPALFVNGEPINPASYMTYFEEFNCYKSFADAGYKLFSVCAYFTERAFSVESNIVIPDAGIFDTKGEADFSSFDNKIKDILDACPDAMIFPRVHIGMPEWWEKENQGETNQKKDGTSLRESIYSDKWKSDGGEMLKAFIHHVQSSDYAEHIIAYHLAGGNTQEWLHYDMMNGGYCPNAEKWFKRFLEEKHPDREFKGLPDIAPLLSDGLLNDEYLHYYLEFANLSMVDAISHFAKITKQETDNKLAVGVFYGYVLDVDSPMCGTHALEDLLADDNVDFVCSPTSYAARRAFYSDMTEQYPVDTMYHHGKACFQELDIRTSLTRPITDHRPNSDPSGAVAKNVLWNPLDSIDRSIAYTDKAFCRQLIKGNCFWWFDMWGGWYEDERIMERMKLYADIYGESMKKSDRKTHNKLAVFIDKEVYKQIGIKYFNPFPVGARHNLARCGVPFDVYEMMDFEDVYRNYSAVVFYMPIMTDISEKAAKLLNESSIPYLIQERNRLLSVEELRAFCKEAGLHTYIDTDDIVFVNNNYLSVCSVSNGRKTIYLDRPSKLKGLLGTDITAQTDTLMLDMKENTVYLFEIQD